MTYQWEPDADTLTHYQLPKSATGEHHTYSELAPLPEFDAPKHPASFCADRGYCEYHQQVAPPRPPQVVKALAHLAGMVDVWEARGQLKGLDSYLARRVPGDTHPLAWARQYRDYQDAVSAGADMLRHPHGGAS